MLDQISSNLADNLRRLREERGLTQQALAELSGVPRPTLAHLESGEANPTLGVMLKVAEALRARVESLIEAPRHAATLYRARSLRTHQRGRAAFLELAVGAPPGVAFERIELARGARAATGERLPGTQQFVVCESGALELRAGEESWQLQPGDVLALGRGAELGLTNRGRGATVAYSLVTPGSPSA
ncbi:MAG: XRE family transcriptional regulator [Sorangiineae bacterium]|nr:XRE family transcriptional regulator [Polyangiaceae bacterium]MEB2322517.1 XRE family transcriptional regulator [Sorangiineae bacterium]